MTQHLGEALTLLASHEANEHLNHMDVDMWGAPSECHDLVSKNERRRYEVAVRRARLVSGMSVGDFRQVLSTRVVHKALEEATGRILHRHPFYQWQN